MIDNPPTHPETNRRSQPESFRAKALSASLTVNDIARSLDWYTRVVGFTLDQKHEREGKLFAASVKAGSVRILLNQDDGAKGRDREKGAGFSLQIVTTQDVDAIARGIKERGGTLLTEPMDMPWGARAFRVQDPDGFKLAISTERP